MILYKRIDKRRGISKVVWLVYNPFLTRFRLYGRCWWRGRFDGFYFPLHNGSSNWFVRLWNHAPWYDCLFVIFLAFRQSIYLRCFCYCYSWWHYNRVIYLLLFL